MLTGATCRPSVSLRPVFVSLAATALSRRRSHPRRPLAGPPACPVDGSEGLVGVEGTVRKTARRTLRTKSPSRSLAQTEAGDQHRDLRHGFQDRGWIER